MTRVTSNEKFKYRNKIFIIIITIILISMIIIINLDYLNLNIKHYNRDFLNYNINPRFYLSISKYYNLPSNILFILIFIHLLISLIAVVKISKIRQGPLRQIF